MPATGGELLVDLLKTSGVEYIFCSPGTEWTPVWEALLKQQGQGETTPKYINCRHEILAISMAMGYAEITGKLPAVLLHSGVGALSGSLAIRNAYVGRVPMLIFSGETCEHCGDDEVRAQGWHWLGLLSDIGGPASLVRDYVKWSNRVDSPDGLVDAISRGSRIALSAPPGPVFISVPTEILLRRTNAYVSPAPSIITPVLPAAVDIEKVSVKLINSKRPIIIGEHAGKKPEAVRRLAELAGLLSIPVFEASLPYTSNFPKENPLYMGYDTSAALQQADLVFVVGGLTPWYPPSAGPGDGATVIMLDEAPQHERLPHWGYRADLFIDADIESTLAGLVDTIRDKVARRKKITGILSQRLVEWRTRHDTMLRRWEDDARAGKDTMPIATRWFLHEAKKALPAGAIILDETLTHTRFVHQYLAEPGGYIKSAYGGLGVGMGEAAGVKLACPDRPVILIIGDGAFNYNPVLAGLGVYQEYGLPVFIIIMDNGGYGAMKWGHQRLYPEGWAARRNRFLGVDITPAPDYVKVAGAFGFYGEKLQEPGEIEAAMKRGLKQIADGKSALLDVILESSPPFPPPPRPAGS